MDQEQQNKNDNPSLKIPTTEQLLLKWSETLNSEIDSMIKNIGPEYLEWPESKRRYFMMQLQADFVIAQMAQLMHESYLLFARSRSVINQINLLIQATNNLVFTVERHCGEIEYLNMNLKHLHRLLSAAPGEQVKGVVFQ